MTFIVGFSDARAFDHAKALGEAMQLANILRDISEDFIDRNRVYLPQNDMTLFAVTESMIAEKKMTPQLFNFVKHYTERTEILFNTGIDGIHYLNHGGFSVLLASRIYRENIRILKKRKYDIFAGKIKISKCKKIIILCTTIILYPVLMMKNKLISRHK
jgi:phytoene synthase